MKKLDSIYQNMPPRAVASLLIQLMMQTDSDKSEEVKRVTESLCNRLLPGVNATISRYVHGTQFCLALMGTAFWREFSRYWVQLYIYKDFYVENNQAGMKKALQVLLRRKAQLYAMENAFAAMCEDAGLDKELMRGALGYPPYEEPDELAEADQETYEGWLRVWRSFTGD